MAFGSDSLEIIIKARDQASQVFSQVESRTKSMSKNLQAAGKQLTYKVSAPIVAVGALSVKSAADFEGAMNRVRGLSGAVGDDFLALQNQAKELGATTAFSAKEAADGMGFLAMAGFDTTKIIGAMPGVLQLAAAAQLDLASAADITSNILTGYGMKTEELSRVNDVLVKTFSSANTDLTQLGEAMKYAGPVASSAGIQFEEAAAAIGMMGNAGIQASMAGTSVRGAISRLLKPTKEVTNGLENLGLTAADLQSGDGGLKSLTEIVSLLETKGAQTADMMAIFGLRAGPAMQALVSQGSEELANFTKQLENAGGTAQRIADTQMEGMPGALKRLASATEGARIAFGEALAPAVSFLADKLQKLMEWFIKLPSSMKTNIAIGLALIAVVGPLTLAIGGLLAILPFVAAGFTLLLGPIGLIMAAMALLAVAVVKNWDKIKAAWSKAKDLWQKVATGIQNSLSSLATFWSNTWSSIKSATSTALDAIISAAQWFWDTFDQVIIGVTGALTGLFLPKILMVTAQTIVELTRLAIQSTIQLAKAGAQWVVMAAKASAQALVITARAIPTILASLGSLVARMVVAAASWTAQWVVMAVQATAQAVRMAAAWVIAMGPVAWVIAAIVALAALIFYNWDFIKAKTIEVWTAVSTWLQNAWSAIKLAWLATWSAISKAFSSVWEGIKNTGKSAANFLIGIAEGVANAWVKGVNTIIGALNSIQISIPDWVPGLGGKSFGINIPLVPKVQLPRFEFGGRVPGPVGKPVAIMAHGQETILPAGATSSRSSGNTYIFETNINNPRFTGRDTIDYAKDQFERAMRDVVRDHKLSTI